MVVLELHRQLLTWNMKRKHGSNEVFIKKKNKKQQNPPFCCTSHPLFLLQPWSALQEVPIYCTVSMVNHSWERWCLSLLCEHPLSQMNF